MWVYMHVSRYSQRWEVPDPPGGGVSGSLELPNVGAEDWTRVLCKSTHMQHFEDFIFNCMHICGGGMCARECGRGSDCLGAWSYRQLWALMWVLNPGPLQEWQTPLLAELSLQTWKWLSPIMSAMAPGSLSLFAVGGSRPCLCISPRTLGRNLFHPQDSWAGRRFLWLHSNHLSMPHTDHRLDCPASPLSPGLRGDPTHKQKKKKKKTPLTRFSEIKAFPTHVPIWKNLSKDKWAWKSSFPSQRVDFSDKVVNCLSVINVKLAAVGPKICNYNNS